MDLSEDGLRDEDEDDGGGGDDDDDDMLTTTVMLKAVKRDKWMPKRVKLEKTF